MLHGHLDDLGRPRQDVEITVLAPSVDWEAQSADEVVETYGRLAEAGAQHLIFSVRGVADTSRLERIAADVFPQLQDRP